MSEFEEKICRYCFDGEESGELISPCKCIGGSFLFYLLCFIFFSLFSFFVFNLFFLL